MTPPTRPVVLERRTAHTGYLTVERLRIRLSDGTVVWREVERHGEGAVVLAYDEARRVALLVRQFRAPVFEATADEALTEACAGMIDDEDAETAARREALEEMGVTLGPLEFVARVWPSPGVSTERHSLFLARYEPADRITAGGGAPGEHEGISVVERSLVSLASDADQGLVTDGKLLTLIFALRLRHPELFVPA